MIVPLLQSTYHHHRNHALAPLHEHRHPASMNRILTPTIPQPILPREQRLIPTIELVVQLPRAAPKSNDALPLPRDPEVVIERRSRVRDLYRINNASIHPAIPATDSDVPSGKARGPAHSSSTRAPRTAGQTPAVACAARTRVGTRRRRSTVGTGLRVLAPRWRLCPWGPGRWGCAMGFGRPYFMCVCVWVCL
jgi:hypothetical protein